MLGTVLGDIALWHWFYLAAKPSQRGGRCGWASMPSALSYGLQSSNDGTELPIRRCLVPSCCSGQLCLSGGMRSPWAWIFDGVLTV
jgi:hypothetical protein